MADNTVFGARYSSYQRAVWPSESLAVPSIGPFASSLESLRSELIDLFCPGVIQTPFSPKNVFLLSDSSTFLLFSTHGQACYIKGDEIIQFDTEFITKNEVRKIIMLNDSEIVICSAKSWQIFQANLESREVTYNEQETSPIFHMMCGQKLFYVLTGTHLLQFSIDSLEKKSFSFWENASNSGKVNASAMDIREEPEQTVAVVLTTLPGIYVYSLTTDSMLFSIFPTRLAREVKLTSTHMFCAFSGTISVFDRTFWEVSYEIKTNSSCSSQFACSPSEYLLAFGCKDGSVIVWNLVNRFQKPLKFMGCTESIEKVSFINEKELYFYSAEQNKLMLVNLTEFPEEYMFPLPGIVKEVSYFPETDKLVFAIKSGGILQINPHSLAQEDKFMVKTTFLTVLSKNTKSLIALRKMFKEKRVKVFRLSQTNLEVQKMKIFYDSSENWWVNALAVDKISGRVLLGFANGLMLILSSMLQMVRDCFIHESQITAIATFWNQSISVSGDEQGNIIQYDLTVNTTMHRYNRHAAPVSALYISRNDEFLISGSQDGVLRISNIRIRACICSIKTFDSAITTLYITENNEYFMVSTESAIFSIWSMKTKSKIVYFVGYSTFLVYQNEEKLCLAGDSKVYILPNPLRAPRVVAYGPGDNSHDYLKYIHSILSMEVPPYQAKWNDWLIFPYKINVGHLFMYLNLTKRFKSALAHGVLFVETANGETPLDPLY